MQNSDHLFVYGTLMKGFDNEMSVYLSATQTFVGEAYFPGLLFKVSFYPGAVFLPDAETNVRGHLFEITGRKSALLKKLDSYEGFGPQYPQPNEFVRKVIPVHHGENILMAFTYLFNKPYSSYPEIMSGDFKKSSLRKF